MALPYTQTASVHTHVNIYTTTYDNRFAYTHCMHSIAFPLFSTIA